MTVGILAAAEQGHIPMLLVIGFAIFFGTIGAKIFQRLRIPQVVGYITIGLLAGKSGFGLIGDKAISSLEPFNFFALGIIGFMIGGELHREVFKKHGRQFFSILLAEGMGAFIVVGVLVSGVAILVGVSVPTSIALGLIFGAISSATAPAATVNVLWEYKARGVLTTAVYAIVALDDALALVLFSIAVAIATTLTGHGAGGLWTGLGFAAYELLGGAAIGLAAGVALNFILRRARDHDNSLALIVGALALLIGAGRAMGMDTILAAMALGAALANLAPRRSRRAFDIVGRFAPPMYVLFFVIVGAQLNIAAMPKWMWALTVPYVVGRSAGKILGANIGSRLAGAPDVLRRYLGLCLFSKGGVAVGLSIVAASRFAGEVGVAIVLIITVTTLFLEIVGPPFVKFAIQKAGEAGLNITEEDLIASYKVAEMVNRSSPAFAEGTPVSRILRTIAETDAMAYPVTDTDGKLTGVITLAELKQSFGVEGLSEWLVAFDLMQPAPDTIAKDAPLSEAVALMRGQDLEYLPVVTAGEDPQLVGLLEMRVLNRSISQEMLRRRQLADGTPTPQMST